MTEQPTEKIHWFLIWTTLVICSPNISWPHSVIFGYLQFPDVPKHLSTSFCLWYWLGCCPHIYLYESLLMCKCLLFGVLEKQLSFIFSGGWPFAIFFITDTNSVSILHRKIYVHYLSFLILSKQSFTDSHKCGSPVLSHAINSFLNLVLIWTDLLRSVCLFPGSYNTSHILH